VNESPAHSISWRAALAKPARPPLITLLTDFGTGDAYAGTMKGVIAALAPRARVIDITHGIPPQNIIAGGLRWMAAAPFFPRGTIHVAVVDPGVGGDREILAARAGPAYFLAPDNGLIGFVADRFGVEEAVRVREERFFLPEVSRTFHGRDVLAPVAARLALGLPLRRLGPLTRNFVACPLPPVRKTGARGGVRLEGVIVDVDNFGNCITNISRGEKQAAKLSDIRVGKWRFKAPRESYSMVPRGRPLAIVGSTGFLEIAVNCGRADRMLGLRRGQRVAAFLQPERSAR
jgi:S-adenosylmethionine hydrolase